MSTRQNIVTAARAWLGTPYHHQARLKGVGVDCVGLVICVARELSLVAPSFDFTGYARAPDGVSIMAAANAHMTPVAKNDMQSGDVVVVTFDAAPQHLGILGNYRHGGLSIIHAASKAGMVVETRLMFSSAMRFVAAFALPGAE